MRMASFLMTWLFTQAVRGILEEPTGRGQGKMGSVSSTRNSTSCQWMTSSCTVWDGARWCAADSPSICQLMRRRLVSCAVPRRPLPSPRYPFASRTSFPRRPIPFPDPVAAFPIRLLYGPTSSPCYPCYPCSRSHDTRLRVATHFRNRNNSYHTRAPSPPLLSYCLLDGPSSSPCCPALAPTTLPYTRPTHCNSLPQP